MPYLLLICLLLFGTFDKIFCQINHPRISNDSTNIYIKCLKLHLKKKERTFGEMKKEVPDKVWIEEYFPITENLPLKIGKFNIQYLGNESIRLLAKERGILPLTVIRPMRLQGNLITVTIIHFGVTVKENQLFYSNEYGSTFKFRFNCIEDKFELIEKDIDKQ